MHNYAAFDSISVRVVTGPILVHNTHSNFMLCTALPLLSAIVHYEEHSLWGEHSQNCHKGTWNLQSHRTIQTWVPVQSLHWEHMYNSETYTWLLMQSEPNWIRYYFVDPHGWSTHRVWCEGSFNDGCCLWAQLIKSLTTCCSCTVVFQWMNHHQALLSLFVPFLFCALDWRKMIIGLMYSMLLSLMCDAKVKTVLMSMKYMMMVQL